MIIYIFIFIIGLIIGSFLNVVIYRLPRKESIVFPGSHCPECNEELKVRDLIPVLSFIFNRGKCRYCGTTIDWQYPVVELLTAVIVILLYFQIGLNTSFIIYSLLIFVLIVCSFIDLKYMIIPNRITYPSILIAIILSIFFNHINILSSLLGILIPAGFLFLIALIYGKGLGMGDVKIVAVIGAVLGWEYTLIAIAIGASLGAIIGLTLIISGMIDRKTRIPFGPFISTGTVLSILFAEDILNLIISLSHY